MRKGFFNGLLAGGILGAIMGMFMSPQLKRDIMAEGKTVKRQARRTMKGMKKTFRDILE
ncbi:hypothetical protein [Thermincola ferriacetica]